MKKTYMKPAMAVEMFTLSQTIANYCGVRPSFGHVTYGTPNSCAFDDGDLNWVEGNNVCTTYVDANGEVDGYCYNAPSENMQIFAS